MTELLLHPALRDVQATDVGYSARFHDLLFIVSINVERDGKKWLHASVSRRGGVLPTYEDLATLKRLCIGEHRTALQVFPPADQHVNWAGDKRRIRPVEVLHLWACLDGDVTPDFRQDLPNGEKII